MPDSLSSEERQSAQQLGLTEKAYLLLKKSGKLSELNASDLLAAAQNIELEERTHKIREILWDIFLTLSISGLFMGVADSTSMRSSKVIIAILVCAYFAARFLRKRLFKFIESKSD